MVDILLCVFLQMGSTLSTPRADSPLGCILKQWDAFDPQTLMKKHWIFFCTQTWPQYQLENREIWPQRNYNTFLQLNLFHIGEGK